MKWISGSTSALVRKWLIPWLIFPLIGIGIYFFTIYKKPFWLITNETFSQGKFIPFSDKIDNGNSESHLTENDSKISYRYTLKEGSPYQYAGIWYVTYDSTWLDLSGYDYIRIKSKMSSSNWITLSLGTHIPGFSVDSKVTTHLYLNQIIPSYIKVDESIIQVKELSTPLWWYSMNQKKESDFAVADLSKVKYITFVHSPNNDLGVENRVDLLEMGLYVDYIPFYYKSAIGLGVYFILSFLGIYIARRRGAKHSIHFSYNKVETQNHIDREEAIIQEYLMGHFSNSDLSITDIQTATGISERKISSIIKTKSGLNFKQYLHQIRLSEARKLLIETEFPIADIAYRCGYSSASHFNKVFKSAENCSPNDFRKQSSPSLEKA